MKSRQIVNLENVDEAKSIQFEQVFEEEEVAEFRGFLENQIDGIKTKLANIKRRNQEME
jgi:hypothetical protein